MTSHPTSDLSTGTVVLGAAFVISATSIASAVDMSDKSMLSVANAEAEMFGTSVVSVAVAKAEVSAAGRGVRGLIRI